MEEKKEAREERNREKLANGDWVMAEFYASWCPHCKRMQPIVEEFKKAMEGTLEVVQVDIDQESALADFYTIEMYPTFILMRKGEQLWRQSGELPLEKLEKAYLLHRCSRYDLQGKEILKTQEKFYLADVALRYSVLGYNADSVASSLENIVYLELCRRGYTVNVGKTGDSEIDFVAVRQNEKIYVQVTQQINSEKTEKREYSRLLEIPDNYPKFVLTTDEFAGGNYEGIKTMHIADFLLSAEY